MSEPTSTKEDELRKKRGGELEGAYHEFGGMLEKMATERASKKKSKSEDKEDQSEDEHKDEPAEEPIRSRWASWKNRKQMRMAQSRALSQKRPYSGLYTRPQEAEE